MNQDQQEEILVQNTKLLRKTLLMPQQTVFETCKRVLQTFVKNGIQLFNKWCQKNEPLPPPQQTEASSPADESSRPHIKYSFEHFVENNIQDMGEDVENADKSLNQGNRTLETFSDDRENSKLPDEEQSFEVRFKKGSKRIKRDPSQSSFQQQFKRVPKVAGKEQRQFMETISFEVFLEVQKKLLEARKIIKERSEPEAYTKYKDYLERSVSVGKLTNADSTHISNHMNRYESNLKRQPKSLRKKVLFEDQSHQLYDLAKVYQSLEAEKTRREEHRRYLFECKRRQQQQKLMMQKLQIQRKAEAQRREAQQAIRRQKQREEQERKLAEAQLEQQKKRQNQKQKDLLSSSLNLEASQSEKKSEDEKQASPAIEDISKSPVVEESKRQLSLIPSVESKHEQQQKKQLVFDTPSKQKQQQQEPKQTPFKQDKSNNPFINPPTKTLNMQDLINNHKPSTQGFFPQPILASPPRSNIFNTQNPVNNLFTGGQSLPPISSSLPSLTPISTNNGLISGFPQEKCQPVFNPLPQPSNPQITNPLHQSPSNPMIQLSNFFNPNPMANNSPGSNFFSASVGQGASASGGLNQSLGLNSSSSSSFMSMPAQPFNKNLFMDQTPQASVGLFGSTTPAASTSSRSGQAGRKKQQQIRIS